MDHDDASKSVGLLGLHCILHHTRQSAEEGTLQNEPLSHNFLKMFAKYSLVWNSLI